MKGTLAAVEASIIEQFVAWVKANDRVVDGRRVYDESFGDRAACKDQNPNDFFIENGDWRKGNKARATCERCPVRWECLLSSLDVWGVEGGIYGGVGPKARRKLKRRLGIVTEEPFDPIADYWSGKWWGARAVAGEQMKAEERAVLAERGVA